MNSFPVLIFHVLLAASTAVILPLPLQGDQLNRNAGESAGASAESGERKLGVLDSGNRLSPLVAELMKLQRSSYETPEARQQAIRQWHATHGPELKAEIDARREMGRPERERMEKEANSRFEKVLDDGVAAGKTGKLEAEFIRLTRTPFNSSEQRRDVIVRWRAQKGVALDAEREKLRAKEAPRIVVLQAEVREHRRQQMDDTLKNGIIGPREAGLMELHYNQDMAPAARQEAIRTWLESHGADLKLEKDARRQRISAEPPSPSVPGDSPAP